MTEPVETREVSRSRAESFQALAESLLVEKSYVIFGFKISKTAMKFIVPMVLFATITAAQVAGALIGHSLALLADCVSMFLDTLTYAGNLWAELHKAQSARARVRNHLIASGVSFMVLFGISLNFLVEAIDVIMTNGDDDGEDGGDNVDPAIVCGFAVAGIVIDLVSILPFLLPDKSHENHTGDDHKPEDLHHHHHASKMNVLSAMTHIFSDLVRSTTTLIESILIYTTEIDSRVLDGYAAVIVTSVILLGLLGALFSWGRNVVRFFQNPAISSLSEPILESQTRETRSDSLSVVV